MTRRKPAPRTPAQAAAIRENNCLRMLAALQTAFAQAGHYDFEKLTEDLDAKFRAKLKETK